MSYSVSQRPSPELAKKDSDPRSRVWSNPHRASFKDLLAVLISHGNRSRGVEQLSAELATVAGSEAGLLQMDPAAIASIKGIGRARAAVFVAAMELARRQYGANLAPGKTYRRQDVLRWLVGTIGSRPQEHLYMLTYSRHRRLIARHELANGALDGVQVYYRDMLRLILNDHAREILLAHNHPAESAVASRTDIQSMYELQAILNELGIGLMDQWIVGDDGVYSCRLKKFLHGSGFQKN